jgi:serine/threonine-protein kinase
MKNRTGEILDGRYELTRLLGEGGMGQVYAGKHVVTGRKVAVKFLLSELADNSEMIERFYREARAATAVGSEHICEVLDMQPPEKGDPFLVMEYLDGMSLKERLQRQKRLPVVEATNIILQVLEALYAAHKAGIVHRDIKPENIFLVQRPDRPILVKLLDFGISKFNPLGGDEDHSLTKTGTVLGTPYYMSPEQASGDRTVGPLSDLYAVGVILYEALTGRVPFDAESFSALVVKIVTHTPPHPSDISPEISRNLGDLVLRAMARNPVDRYQSCKDMAEALRLVASGQSIPIQSINAADASFAAVALPTQTGPQPMSISGVTPVLPAQPSGVGYTTDPSMQTSTPMAMSRSFAEAPASSGKTWLLVGGGVVAVLAICAVVAVVVVVPRFSSEMGGVATRAPAPPPPPPVTPVNPDPVPPVETPPATPLDGGTASPAGDAAPQTVDTGPAKVRVTIRVTPPEAVIFLDDSQVEGNPAEVEVVADGASHRVRAEAEGHQEASREFTASADTQIDLDLRRRSRTPHTPSGSHRVPPGGNRTNPVTGVVNPWGD